jgi:2-iminobutanoate/2-iminopropanoate deaminase
VIAVDLIFLAHHAGGFESNNVVQQIDSRFEKMAQAMGSVGASLDDMMQINLYLKNIEDFRKARDVFFKYFKNGFPARMSTTTEFLDAACLCMLDGIAYKKGVCSLV